MAIANNTTASTNLPLLYLHLPIPITIWRQRTISACTVCLRVLSECSIRTCTADFRRFSVHDRYCVTARSLDFVRSCVDGKHPTWISNVDHMRTMCGLLLMTCVVSGHLLWISCGMLWPAIDIRNTFTRSTALFSPSVSLRGEPKDHLEDT